MAPEDIAYEVRNGDTKNLMLLAEHFKGLAIRQAEKFILGWQKEDFVNDLPLNLYKWSLSWEPERAKFDTYVSNMLRYEYMHIVQARYRKGQENETFLDFETMDFAAKPDRLQVIMEVINDIECPKRRQFVYELVIDGLSLDEIAEKHGTFRDAVSKKINAKCRLPRNNRKPLGSRSGTKKYTYEGETKTALEWSEDPRCLVSVTAFQSRIQLGWSVEDTITTPSQKYKRKADMNFTVQVPACKII